jgi:hypothetical protein
MGGHSCIWSYEKTIDFFDKKNINAINKMTSYPSLAHLSLKSRAGGGIVIGMISDQ